MKEVCQTRYLINKFTSTPSYTALEREQKHAAQYPCHSSYGTETDAVLASTRAASSLRIALRSVRESGEIYAEQGAITRTPGVPRSCALNASRKTQGREGGKAWILGRTLGVVITTILARGQRRLRRVLRCRSTKLGTKEARSDRNTILRYYTARVTDNAKLGIVESSTSVIVVEIQVPNHIA